MSLKSFLINVFTWWNGATIGTRLWIRRAGELVGQDEQGNTYYRSRKIDPALNRERRWVIYNGEADASRIPAGWHGWMHHRTDVPPVREEYRAREWQLPHKANMTGTAYAYRPAGSILSDEPDTPQAPEYRAWKPGA